MLYLSEVSNIFGSSCSTNTLTADAKEVAERPRLKSTVVEAHRRHGHRALVRLEVLVLLAAKHWDFGVDVMEVPDTTLTTK